MNYETSYRSSHAGTVNETSAAERNVSAGALQRLWARSVDRPRNFDCAGSSLAALQTSPAHRPTPITSARIAKSSASRNRSIAARGAS